MAEFEVTPNSVAANLAHLARDLAAITDGLKELEHRAVESREDFTMAYHTEYLRAGEDRENGKPLSVETRKSKATVATHAQRLSAEVAEALVRGRRAQIASLKVRIDVGRSVGAVVRSELDFERVRP